MLCLEPEVVKVGGGGCLATTNSGNEKSVNTSERYLCFIEKCFHGTVSHGTCKAASVSVPSSRSVEGHPLRTRRSRLRGTTRCQKP